MTTEEILQRLSLPRGPLWDELLIETEMQYAEIEQCRPGSLRLTVDPSKMFFNLRSGRVGIIASYKGGRVEWIRHSQADLRQLPERSKGHLDIVGIGGQSFFAVPGQEAFPDNRQAALYLIGLLFD